MKVALDVGCGSKPRNPYKCEKLLMLEPSSSDENVIPCFLGFEPIPLETSSIDVVTAFDVIEHIPRVVWKDSRVCNPFIDAMNEIWRVLKPGGIFYAQTPAYPRAEAFQDPTHVNFITTATANYFARGGFRVTKSYGFVGAFEVRKNDWSSTSGFHLIWELIALKPET